jgi:heme oxygenase
LCYIKYIVLIISNFLAQLKSDTLANHQQLEKNLVGKLKGMQTADDYIRILQLFYGYFAALEDQINKYIGIEKLTDYADRRKTLSIKNDLIALKGEVPEKALAVDLPEINDALQAFGALYVIEGSTLGGQVISKMIAKQLPHETQEGLSFFTSYGDDTMLMWNQFKTVLESQATSTASSSIIIQAANETFFKFKLWMEKHDC